MKRHPLVKGLAAGIGLASEYTQSRKEQKAKKEAGSNQDSPPSDPPRYEDIAHGAQGAQPATQSTSLEHVPASTNDEDERQWELDEAQDELRGTDNESQKESKKVKGFHDPVKYVKQFTMTHPPTPDFRSQGLPLPVVLPQRRPKDRTRGFIRAYAPMLQDCDIDQATFLQFIETFNEATTANPRLEAINLSSFAFSTLPTAASMGTSIAITIAVKIAKNTQSRYRHNYILQQLNDEFFGPRGLYALVLTWNPESNAENVDFDLNETIAANSTKHEGTFEKAKHNFRPSMGDTSGVAFSETAPLIFPSLDALAQSQSPEAAGYKAKIMAKKSFVDDYFDRRAQAQYSGENPDSQLATETTFRSKYSDPNNPTNSGDLMSLVSGGKYSSPVYEKLSSRGRGSGASRGGRSRGGLSRGGGLFSHSQQQSHQSADQISGEGTNAYATTHQSHRSSNPTSGPLNGPIAGGVKRVFKHHILYLAVVNMPSDEDMVRATEYLNQAKATA